MNRILVLCAALLALSLGAAAQPRAATALSDYVPGGVLLYAELNIDDATVDAFDSLVANLTDRVGIEDVPTLAGVVQLLGARQWIGGQAALAVLPSSLETLGQQSLLLVRIRDRAQVEAFLLEQEDTFSLPPQGEWSNFAINGLGVGVTDDLLIAATGLAGATIPQPGGPSLTAHAPYVEALAALPAEAYAARAYVDLRALAYGLALDSRRDVAAAAINIPALGDALGYFAAGLTQLDDRSYALDVAHIYGSGHVFEGLFAVVPPVEASAPIDLDWLSILPDDVVFAGQFTRPWATFRTWLETFAIGGTALRSRVFASAALFEDITGLSPAASPLTAIPPSLSSAAVLNTIEGIVDMTDAELTAAFDGQAALALRARDVAAGHAIDVLFAAESSGLEAGQKVVRGVQSILPLFTLPLIDAGDDDILFEPPGPSIAGPLHLLADVDALYFGSDALILADKQTFVAVPRLTEAEPFVHDRAFFLDGATSLAYLHLPPLRNLSFRVGGASPQALTDLFDSLWISARTEAGRSVSRFGFTMTP